MKVKIFSFEKHIGTAELHAGDISMGHLYGEFIPVADYYKYTQNVWALNGSTNSISWETLKLTAQNETAETLEAAEGITIDDFEAFQDELNRIDIAGLDLVKLGLSS